MRRFVALSLVLVAACSRDQKPADSTLSQDLALAGQVQQQAMPTFQDTALRVAAEAPDPAAPPVAPPRTTPALRGAVPVTIARPGTPAPQPSAPQPAFPDITPAPVPGPAREIGAGASLSLVSTSRVCTRTHRPGDKIVATLQSAVSGSNGAELPAGSSVVLEVVSVPPAGTDGGALTFRVRSIVVGEATYAAFGDVTPTTEYERARIAGDPGQDKRKVIGGAVAGAVIGKILGGGTKGTVIGAAAGAATGAAASRAGAQYESCLPQGAGLRVDLRSPVVM